jgi:glycerol uptake facilitator-like aquaporin
LLRRIGLALTSSTWSASGDQHLGQSCTLHRAAILLAFGGEGWALGQLWLFWLAPIVGGIVGALLYRTFAGSEEEEAEAAAAA